MSVYTTRRLVSWQWATIVAACLYLLGLDYDSSQHTFSLISGITRFNSDSTMDHLEMYFPNVLTIF